MMRAAFPVGALALMALASGCMTSPSDSQVLGSRTEAVRFSGYALQSNATVQLSAADGAGAFQRFASAPIATTAELLPGGQSFYPWEVTATIPQQYWSRVPGCSHDVARVEGRQVSGTGNYPLYTFDPGSWACVSTELAFGAATRDATARCASQVPVRLVAGAGAVHAGDLVIRSQAEADRYRCVEVIQGNLVVSASEPLTTFPNLRQVTGDLVIESRFVPGPSGLVPAEVKLDELTSVGGSLTLRFGGEPRVTWRPYVNFGLPRLGSVGRDVNIDVQHFDVGSYGLPRLTRVYGDLRISTVAGSELSAGGLLEKVRLVSGSVTIRGPRSVTSLLFALERIEGNLLLELTLPEYGDVYENVLPRLREVSGNLTFSGAQINPRVLPALSQVRGYLNFFGMQRYSQPLAATALAVGGLQIVNTRLNAFPVALAPATQLAPTAVLRVQNNPELCASAINAFVSSQAGWSGTRTISGNNDGC